MYQQAEDQFQKTVRERAYQIWLEHKHPDPDHNYFQALEQLEHDYPGNEWRKFVETSSDRDIIACIANLSDIGRQKTAYWCIALERQTVISGWWNNSHLPQLTPEQLYCSLLALKLFQYCIKPPTHTTTRLIIAILRSRVMRDLYPHLFHTFGGLRGLLIGTLTGIPTGTQLLWTALKPFNYRVGDVWRGEFIRSFSYETAAKTWYVPSKFLFTLRFGGKLMHCIAQICRYGNLRDIKCMIKNLPWQEHFAEIFKNKHRAVFRYMIEYIWTVKKAFRRFSLLVQDIIWRECFLYKLCKDNITLMLQGINYGQRRYRTRMLCWVLPELCTPKLLCRVFSFSGVEKIIPRLLYCKYHNFSDQRPRYPTPQMTVWIKQQRSLSMPIPCGTFYHQKLPSEAYPHSYYKVSVHATITNINDRTVFLITDAEWPGRWDQRVERQGREHPYWRGPYQSLEADNRALNSFLSASCDHKVVWWPLGVYSTAAFKSPQTPYANKGWMIAGIKGPLLKFRPPADRTIDLLYKDGKWSALDDRTSLLLNVENVAPRPPLPLASSQLTVLPVPSQYVLLAILIEAVKQISVASTLIKFYIANAVLDLIEKFSHVELRSDVLALLEKIKTVGCKRQYNNYEIWSCRPINNGLEWVPVRKRIDKFLPSPDIYVQRFQLGLASHEKKTELKFPDVFTEWDPEQLVAFTGPVTKMNRQKNSLVSKFVDITDYIGHDIYYGCARNICVDPCRVALEQFYFRGVDRNCVWLNIDTLGFPRSLPLLGGRVLINNVTHLFAITEPSWNRFMDWITTCHGIVIVLTALKMTVEDYKPGWAPGIWQSSTARNHTVINKNFVKECVEKRGYSLQAEYIDGITTTLYYFLG